MNNQVLIGLLFVFTLLPSFAIAQTEGVLNKTAAAEPQNSLEELLRANAHPISIQNQTFSGAGAEVIKSSLKNVQFVAMGEWHNRRAVHKFGGALFRLLHNDYEFNYFALEEDPYLGKLISQTSRKGGGEEMLKLALRYPNAFHLLTESELEMLSNVGKLSKAPVNPIWGLNQVFGATHYYERLLQLAPDANARAIAQSLLNKALEYEKERFLKKRLYLVVEAKPEDFKQLRAAFRPKAGSEADFLITQIALSNQIFLPYGAKPRPPLPVFYESGRTRETNMKHLFNERYREAQAKGVKIPKVLAFFGHWHLYRGLSEQTDLFTLGNFLSELATFNNMESFHIYTVIDLPQVRQGWQAPLAQAASEIIEKSKKTNQFVDGAVIDLRPLKPLALTQNPDSAKINPSLRRLILGYDVFVFLSDGEMGSIERLRTPNFRLY